MRYTSLHIHSLFCDGYDSILDIIKEAIKLNLDTIGILYHSYTSFDESYCIKKDKIDEFINLVERYKKEFQNLINIKHGVEQDYFSETDTKQHDYLIGSVHYIKKNDKYYPIDSSKEETIKLVNELYNGDYYEFSKDYFNLVSQVVSKTKCTIIGHFDLVTKYNLFDTDNEKYRLLYKNAVDKLIPYNIPFEINTSIVDEKGEPYPSLEIINYIKSKGGKFILSSDAHKKENLIKHFDEYIKYIGD
ncbi:histidinol-phosphatase HisJ family protein [bacterium]|nr:histidinol-phosphatase HisJ family protein [bacterium]